MLSLRASTVNCRSGWKSCPLVKYDTLALVLCEDSVGSGSKPSAIFAFIRYNNYVCNRLIKFHKSWSDLFALLTTNKAFCVCKVPLWTSRPSQSQCTRCF